ncbi:hypothetical protein H5410_007888 [Solanum commersonii]|uniref:Uncharacterized protein n=1 Tax=Solanum commersonii TaxID=4109 RepID=A0A9J6ADB7_SOLCO|nr:hypothetical protein H5410_007888 [Solanum commersonii]
MQTPLSAGFEFKTKLLIWSFVLHCFRFDGVTPEPRKGFNSGHVPGSKCIPFPQFFLFHLLYKVSGVFTVIC